MTETMENLPYPPPDAYTLAPLIIASYSGPPPESDKYHGHVTATFSSGNTYTGTFNNGYMEGEGIYEWNDGAKYKGEFKKNRIVGKGTYIWKSGCKYEGEVINGLRHGKGTFWCEPVGRAWYEGEWRDGGLCGQGKLVYGPDSYYEGTFLDGLKHGHGTMYYASGNVYEGEWEGNVKKGWGIMRWNDRGDVYEGEWKDGKPNGRGTYTWMLSPTAQRKPHQFPLQNTYTGTWLNGVRHGHGTFTYANGASYTGEWEDNMKHGVGAYVSENGRRFVGEWKRDRPVGDGIERYQNECPYILTIADLVPLSTPIDATLRQINNVVLRHISDIRSIYTIYAMLGRKPEALIKETILQRWQLVSFLRDCGVGKSGTSLADMNRVYARQFRNDPCFSERYNSPHCPQSPFILHDFIGYILRASHLLYGHRTDLSLHEHGLAACLAWFFKTDVMEGKLKREREKSQRELMEDDLYWDIKREYAPRLSSLYIDKASRYPRKALPESAGDATVTMRQVLFMLKDYGLLTELSSGPLTVQRVISVCRDIVPTVEDGDCYNLEFEIVPLEFFDITYTVARILHEDFYNKNILPLFGEGAKEPEVTVTALEVERSHSMETRETDGEHGKKSAHETIPVEKEKDRREKDASPSGSKQIDNHVNREKEKGKLHSQDGQKEKERDGHTPVPRRHRAASIARRPSAHLVKTAQETDTAHHKHRATDAGAYMPTSDSVAEEGRGIGVTPDLGQSGEEPETEAAPDEAKPPSVTADEDAQSAPESAANEEAKSKATIDSYKTRICDILNKILAAHGEWMKRQKFITSIKSISEPTLPA